MKDQTFYQVDDGFGGYRNFQTLKKAGEFAEEVLVSTGDDDIGIFEVKEVASVNREVSFSLHIYE